MAIGLSACLISGCATLTKPQMAEVRLSSHPQNVQVLLNGYDQGVTPMTLSIDRKMNHNVTFMMRGHQPIHVQIKPKLDVVTTVFGNLVSWNVVGVVVDLVTGRAYTLTPSDIDQNIVSIVKSINYESSNESINVFIMTKSDWEKILASNSVLVTN